MARLPWNHCNCNDMMGRSVYFCGRIIFFIFARGMHGMASIYIYIYISHRTQSGRRKGEMCVGKFYIEVQELSSYTWHRVGQARACGDGMAWHGMKRTAHGSV